MKKIVFLLAAGLVSGASSFAASPLLDSEEGWNTSYSMGYQSGFAMEQQLSQQNLRPDQAAFLRGFHDRITGSQPALTTEKMELLLRSLQQEQVALRQKTADDNVAAGLAFLEKNAGQAGVTELPSGVQYRVIKAGSGPHPKSTDRVKVHYRGTLIDGTEFDSSYARDEPAEFPVSAVIRGWQEAVQKMQVGSKWQVFIPPHLAYGERGAGKLIGPNATLIFEMELLEIL